jgi:hypothetical protein
MYFPQICNNSYEIQITTNTLEFTKSAFAVPYHFGSFFWVNGTQSNLKPVPYHYNNSNKNMHPSLTILA